MLAQIQGGTQKVLRGLEKRVQTSASVLLRLVIFPVILTLYLIIAILHSLALLFGTNNDAFLLLYQPNNKKGYTTSYTDFMRRKQRIRMISATSFAITIALSVLTNSLVTNVQPVYAATCNINSNTTVDQTYVNSNNCQDIHITGNATITFSGSLDLSGSGTFYVDNTVKATFSGALNLTDANDAVILNGTAQSAAGSTVGVNITTQNLTISSTGSINQNNQGCSGGVSGGNGQGPDTSTGVCTITTSGYGDGSGSGGGAGGGHGGAGGRGFDAVTSGTTYGSNTAPILNGAAGGGGSTNVGGFGGGVIRVDVAGTLTVSGTISANGQAGNTTGNATQASGGGAGGSIYVTAGTLAGSSTITAAGGAGADGSSNDGGGGGGGRIAVYYNTLSGFTLSNITATKGSKGGAGQGSAADGTNGTTFILDRKTDDGSGTLTITSGLDFVSGGDYTRTNITAASGAILSCGTFATLDLTATGTLTFNGVPWTCNTVDTINITAGTWTTSGTNALTLNKAGAVVNLSISNDLTLNTTTITGSAGGTATSGGVINLSNAINVSLVSSTINSNVNWTGLSSLNIDSGSTINANFLGCTGGNGSGGNGYGPNTSTGVCAVTTSGYGDGSNAGANGGGAAHGGAGGRGGDAVTSGPTYGTSTAPTLIGSGGGSGGNTNVGGTGGGKIRLDVTGTLTVNGAVSANGQVGSISSNPSYGSGGGAGGSIHVTAGTLAGSSTIAANGGNGGDGSSGDGGGAGGGRIAVYYDTLSTFTLANITATKGSKGGAGQGSAADGTNGTTFILDRKTDDGAGTLTITSGLDFISGGDYTRATITASSGAVLSCGTFATLNLAATGTLTFNAVTWTCSTVDTINITAGTWTTSGTNALTLNKAGAVVNLSISNDLTLNTTTITGSAGGTATSGGVINLSNAINVSLVSSTINSNVNWTGLSSLNIDSGSTINANFLGCSAGTGNGNAGNGYGPNTSTGVCAITTSGYGDGSNTGANGGGAGHGGAGGRGGDAVTGATYGTNTAPTLLGSGGGSGGNTNAGGFGGGSIRLGTTGTLTINGALSANGAVGSIVNNGSFGAGGGSGGSVYITAGTVAGSSTITTTGGAGGDAGSGDGGGGGGGRVAIYYGSFDTFSLSNATATKGLKGGAGQNSATDGSDGTVYSLQYTVASTPTVTTPSASATNQSRNIALVSSAYSSNGAAHTSSDWQISDDNTFSDANCSDTNIVWCKLTSSNLTGVTVNTTNGTFQNALSGKSLLAPNTTYYVRVRYNNAAGGSTWSNSVTFTTQANTVPGTPTNSAPVDTATNQSKNPTLSASTFSDADGDSQLSSDWLVYESSTCSGTPDWSKTGDTSNLTSIVVNSTNGTFADALAGQTTLKSHTAYSFKVRYLDTYSATSSYSTCTSFTTLNNDPTFTGTIPTQDFLEDSTHTNAFDLDTYFNDVDFNDLPLTCSISNTFTAGLGIMTVNADHSVDFALAANANGSDTVAFSCQDGGGVSVGSNTVTVNVTGVNDAPSFTKGSNQTVLEDAGAQTVTGWATGMSTGPSDESSQTLTFNVSNDNNGLFSVQPSVNTSTGNLTYTPAANANGAATVTINLSDDGGTANSGSNTSADQTFTITVTAVNDAPTADAASITTNEDTTYTGTLTGSDVEGSALTYSIVSQGSKGTATVTNANTGAFSYVPNSNSNGSDSFTFKVNDGTVDSAAGTISVTITAVNDTPTSNAASITTNEDTTYTGTLSASDVDNDPLTYSIVANGTRGTATVTNAATGAFNYVPIANNNGSDSFTFRVNDGTVNSSTATISVTITAVNDAPSFTKGADQTVLEDVGARTVSTWATSISKGPSNESSQVLTFNVSNNNHALFSAQPAISSTGTLTYTPAANANGSATVTVNLSDDGGTANSGSDTSADQTFTITVTAVNDTPTADDASLSTDEDTTYTGTLTGSDIDGNSLTYSIVSQGGKGTTTVTDASTGAFSYVPNSNANGSDSFTFKVNDGTVDSTDATITVTINAVNDAPTANAASITTNEDTTYTGTLTGSDVEGSSLTYSIVSQGSKGTAIVTNAATGAFSYAPNSNSNGSDSFTFKVNDGTVDSTAATISVTITAVNDAPSFTKGSNQTVLEDAGAQTVTGWATAISAGPSNESSQVLSFTVTTDSDSLFSALPAVSASTGNLTYTPAANANGSATVTVTLNDDGGTANSGSNSSSQTFTITVTAVNDAPVANANSFSVDEDTTYTGTLTGSDVDGNSLTYSIVSQGSKGTATVTDANTGAFSYVPTGNSNGSDSFTFKVNDGTIDSAAATISVTINAINDTPTANAASITTNEDTTYTGTLTGSDVDGNSLTYSIVSQGSKGTATVTDANTGAFSYVPTGNSNGSDSFTFKVNDGTVDSAAATISVTITAVNDTPAFTKGADQTVLEDSGARTASNWATGLSTGPSNESSQALTFNVNNNNNPLFSIQPAISNTGTLTFTPAANANGSAMVTVTLSDDGGTANSGDDTSDSQTFTITVTAVNDTPSFTKGADQSILEDAGAQTVAGWATAMSAGQSNESSQALTFNVSTDNDGLFSALPAVNSTNGNLTYTPAANANGVATVTVTLSDDGGTANSGDDTSDSQTFTITITSINDAPSFTKGADQTVAEDSGAKSISHWATAISSGPSDESGQTVSFLVSNNNNGLFSSQPALTNSGALSFTPAANASGSATVSVIPQDNGGTANSGNDTGTTKSFIITVTAVNDAPNLSIVPDQTVNEGDTITIELTATDPENDAVTFSVADTDNDFAEHGLEINSLFTDNGNDTATFTWAPGAQLVGTYVLTFTVSDGTATNSDAVTITVDDSDSNPVFSGALPVVSMLAGQTASNVFDLDDYFTDPEGQTLTYTSTNPQYVTIDVSADHEVSVTAPADFSGSDEVTFTATDPLGQTATSNALEIVLTNQGSGDDINLAQISHVSGTVAGPGTVVVIGQDGQILSNWTAYPVGGVIPRIGLASGELFIYTVKNRSGSTMSIYSVNGTLQRKKRISPNVHWRRLAVGNLRGDSTSDEIVSTTSRDHKLYFKVYSYHPRTRVMKLEKRTIFGPLYNRDYSVTIAQKAVHIVNTNGKTVFDWKAF